MSERRARTARPLGRPRSRHFLRPRIAAELVRAAGLTGDELVLDLGAGSGRLTAELARSARRVVAVELDPGLAAGMRGRGSVHVHQEVHNHARWFGRNTTNL